MKNIKYLSVLLVLGLLFVSCEKQPQESEWEKYYGYTNAEIAGSYSFSNVADAFDGLTEGAYCHICPDAKIDIVGWLGSNIVQFNVNCPSNEFNRTFEGRPRLTDDDFLINMKYPSSHPHPDYELTAYVYKNKRGNIRLHGFARHITYETHVDTNNNTVYQVTAKVNYYFDVIKN
ncbi:MAG: hypothetical protein IKH61_07445 [Bacteroidales bacterium]|jgi:hypothetical protein|nr:hypothetical protein [Bacteroidales bacterium]